MFVLHTVGAFGAVDHVDHDPRHRDDHVGGVEHHHVEHHHVEHHHVEHDHDVHVHDDDDHVHLDHDPSAHADDRHHGRAGIHPGHPSPVGHPAPAAAGRLEHERDRDVGRRPGHRRLGATGARCDEGILVVGGIHGNEPASPPAVRAFVGARIADDVSVWLLPELNPDGVAAGTRWNANGVDLNRNFPWDWRASTGGPSPLSEPESATVAAFVQQQRPTLIVWVHQPLGYVSSVADTDRRLETAWSSGSRLPTRSGVTQHGGGESWTFFDAGLPSMLVEIDTWEATPEIVADQVAGFQALLDELGWS